MRRGQGLPVNMIVLVALSLLVLVVIGSFFITGFGQAGSSINTVDADQADCQNLCQSLVMAANNYEFCTDVNQNPRYAEWAAQGCYNFGDCTVNARKQTSCKCGQSKCAGNDETLCDDLCGELIEQATTSPKTSCTGIDGLQTAVNYLANCPLESHSCTVPMNYGPCEGATGCTKCTDEGGVCGDCESVCFCSPTYVGVRGPCGWHGWTCRLL